MRSSLPGYDRPPVQGPYGGAGYGSPPALATEGVMTRRLVAYALDVVFIFLFSAALFLLILLVGLLTFGLGWGLLAILPASGILYSALTVGGRKQSTVGMRMAGLRAVNAVTGGRVDTLTAAFHALLFYLAVGTMVLWLADVVLGLLREDRRFGHDLLSGVAIVRG